MQGWWYYTYQLECDRCGQVLVSGPSHKGAGHAADRHEGRNPGHGVWSACMVLCFAPDPLLGESAVLELV